ncbi:MAG: hypothetical protein Fur0043_13180 [Anaerolineales bacterium]
MTIAHIQVIMNSMISFSHASRQAPWRIQRQWVSLFLLVVLGFAGVAGLYLRVTSQAAILGRQIQDLREEILVTQYENADLQTELAHLTAKEEIERRAYEMGLRPVQPQELEYLVVPGYTAPQAALLASVPELRPSAPTLRQEYNQSLLDWLEERLQAPGGLP